MSSASDSCFDISQECTKGTLRYPELEQKLNNLEEVFVPLFGYENDHVVSNTGKVKRKLLKDENNTKHDENELLEAGKKRCEICNQIKSVANIARHYKFCKNKPCYGPELKFQVRYGTHAVKIYESSTQKTITTLTLRSAVLNSFYVNPHKKFKYIIHKDKNQLNNNLDNLLFATIQYKQNERPAPAKVEEIDMNNEYTKGILRYPELEQLLLDGKEEVFVDAYGGDTYVISNFGILKHKLANGQLGKPLKGHMNERGYNRHTVMTNGKREYTHILVLNSFYMNPNPSKFCTIDHNDKDRSNNHLSNLNFASKKFQTWNQNRNIEIHGKKLRRPIHMLSLDGVFIREFGCSNDALQWLINNNLANIHEHNVNHIRSAGKNNRDAFGYKWKYIEIIDIENEVWKDVSESIMKGTNAPYVASNYGRIKNKHGKLIIGSKEEYIRVNQVFLHRIIALTFIENDDPVNKKYVNHISGDKFDNRVCNLEWCTHQENCRHVYENGLNKTAKKIQVTNVTTGGIEVYNNKMDCKRVIGVSPGTMRKYIDLKQSYTKNGVKYLFEIIEN